MRIISKVVAGVLSFLGCVVSHAGPSLEDRVAALEALTTKHSSQLAQIFTSHAESPQVVLPQNNYYRLASLALPAGRYMFSGQVFGRSADNQPKNEGIGCQVRISDRDGGIIGNGNQIGGGQASLLSFYFEVNPTGTFDLPVDGIIWIECRTSKANTVVVEWSRVVAVSVPTYSLVAPMPPVLAQPK